MKADGETPARGHNELLKAIRKLEKEIVKRLEKRHEQRWEYETYSVIMGTVISVSLQ